MEISVVRILSGYAKGRKVLLFTHDGGGPNGRPAIAYSPALEESWWLDNHEPISEIDQRLVQQVSMFLEKEGEESILRRMDVVQC